MNTLTPTELAIGLVVLLAVAGLILWLVRSRSSAHLRSKFGPEYDRAVRNSGSRRKAESDLHERQKRVAAFDTRPLSVSQRNGFIETWQQVQARFVDDPAGALDHADVLLADVMAARGYPVTDFDHRAEDLSVDHPDVVQNYRAGRDIARRHVRGEASTEDLRQAMIHYRALFDELVNEPDAITQDPPRDIPRRERLRP